MYIVPVLNNVITKAVPLNTFYSLDTNKVKRLYEGIIKTSMGLCSASEFNVFANFLESSERKNLRHFIRTEPKLLLNLRGFLLYICQKKITLEKEVLKAYRLFDVGETKNLTETCQNLEILSLFKDLNIYSDYKEKLDSYPEVLTPDKVKRLCQDELKKLNKFINNFTYRKLRFIASSNNMDIEDIANDIRFRVCTSCYFSQMQLRDLYLTNTLKSSISSYGLNLIKYYTTKDRQRLVRTISEDGEETFQNIVSSTTTSNDDGEESDLLNVVGDPTNHYNSIERKVSFYFQKQKIKEQYGRESVHSKIVEILDNDCVAFVNWYNLQNNTNVTQVIDIQEEEGKEFLKRVQEFVNIKKPSELQIVLSTLKPRFLELIGD